MTLYSFDSTFHEKKGRDKSLFPKDLLFSRRLLELRARNKTEFSFCPTLLSNLVYLSIVCAAFASTFGSRLYGVTGMISLSISNSV